MSTIAHMHQGELYHPKRLMPAHDCHEETDAVFEDFDPADGKAEPQDVAPGARLRPGESPGEFQVRETAVAKQQDEERRPPPPLAHSGIEEGQKQSQEKASPANKPAGQ